ncbi:unnamed protein product [Spirodela intermedia]|uniref:Rubisco LSMT substrate-binding domain-containing protein n=1 Tax=Spirodela intermedia TaxID=51605 RepID=A0A7I8JJR1_SPIIN|nr:unnamed protein product [Spirodela intermedia]CAA6670101.1 unnamed protein product [Spirodela intermedia]
MAEVSRSFRSSLLPQFPRNLRGSLSRRSAFSPVLPRRSSARCSLSTASSSRAGISEGGAISWGCEIESLENAEELQRWLTESGLPPQKMGIDRVEVGERGLKLLFVPPSLVITSDSEWSSKEAGDVLRKYPVPDWPYLATLLVKYISALPRQPYSLLYWTRSELDTFLVASPIRERAIERINDVIGTYNDLRDRIFSKYPNLFPEEVFNIETFLWSFGILFSRLVRLPSMDGKLALVPGQTCLITALRYACLSYFVEAFLDYDKSSQGIVFTTDRAYQPGEQVIRIVSHAVTYGFLLHAFLVSLNKSDKCYKEKLEALKKHGLSTPQRFPLQVTGWPSELMAYAYLAVSPPSMGRQFEEMAAAAASGESSFKKGISYQELEESVLQFILDSCESINRKLLLKQLASDLCTSEQRILFRTQYILRRRLRDMRTGGLRALGLFNGIRNIFK